MATVTATVPGPRARARHWFPGLPQREAWAAFPFLSPWLFGFFVFTAGPMIASLILSFSDYSVIQTTHNVGWDNSPPLVHDPKVRSAMKTTLIYTVMVVPAHVVLSLGLALVLARIRRLGGVFRTLFYLPVATPAVAVGVLYLLLFNGDHGLINSGLGLVGIHGPFWETDPHWVKPSLVIMHLWKVGASVVILLAALMAVPQHLYEASAMDGAGKWRRFWDVTVPMISPALFFIIIINTIAALQTFDEVYTAFFNASTPFGTDATLFYSIYLFQEAFVNFHMGYASALAWGLFLVIAVVTAIQVYGSRRFVYYEGDKR